MVADGARAEDAGDEVSYVICRNINFTNICYVGCTLLRLLAPQARRRRLRPRARRRPRARARRLEARRQRGLHPGRHPSQQGRLLVPRHRARDQGRAARDAPARLLARGDRLGPASLRRHAASRLPRHAARRRAGHDPRHGGRDPPRRRAPRDRAAQDHERALVRDRERGARGRSALDLDDHVRPRRAAAPHRAPLRPDPRAAEAHRRLHRVRAARLHPPQDGALPRATARAPARACPRTCA